MPPAPLGLLAIGGLIVVIGLVASRVGYPAFAFQRAVLGLASGWVVGVAGMAAWYGAPSSRTGPLLVAAAATGFLGSFEAARWPVVAEVAGHLTWLWVAIIAHAILAQPDGRLRTRTSGVLAVMVYATAVLAPADDPRPVAVAIIVAVGVRRLVDGPDPRRGSAGLAAVLAVGALLAPTVVGVADPRLPLNVVAVALAGPAAAAVLLAADAIRLAPSPVRVTDAVLRLDPSAPVTVIDELRRASGDPSLELAFPTPGMDGLIDARGRPLHLPDPASGRVVTPIPQGDGPPILVIHDRRMDTEAALSMAASRAVAMAAANARLQAELAVQVDELLRSRQRLLVAADEERAALERVLATDLEPGLARLEALLTTWPADERLMAARQELAAVRGSLRSLADGLHPRALASGDLRSALERLAAHSPVAVGLDVAGLPRLATMTAAAAWSVCSEGIVNAAKHAGVDRVQVTAHASGQALRVTVTDEGRGGASAASGTGLRGLSDRVEAVGGALTISSPPGAGTRLEARLPLGAPEP